MLLFGEYNSTRGYGLLGQPSILTILVPRLTTIQGTLLYFEFRCAVSNRCGFHNVACLCQLALSRTPMISVQIHVQVICLVSNKHKQN